MPVLIVGSEKNFAALRPRLFSGTVSTKAAGEVADALQAANPHVDLKKLEPGTVLTVPDLPHVSVGEAVLLDDNSQQAIAGLAETGHETLAALSATAQSSATAAAAERKQLVKSLAAKELATAAKKDKEVAAALKAAQDGLAAEDAAAKERAAALERAQAEWSKELAEIRKLLP
jgi:hypothetical protein